MGTEGIGGHRAAGEEGAAISNTVGICGTGMAVGTGQLRHRTVKGKAQGQ